MIFDRTQNDIDAAVSLIKEKVQKFLELTEDEVESLERGTLTYNAINRIEAAEEELVGIFNSLGYWNLNIENKSWGEKEIFYLQDFERIIENLTALRNCFFVYGDTPNAPEPSYHFQTLNNIEKTLFDLNAMVGDIQGNFRYCGDVVCG